MAPHLLIFHSNQDLLQVLHQIFVGEGQKVFSSLTLYEDLSTIERLQPAVILLEAQTRRRREGMAYLRRLKGFPATASIPVILLATRPDVVDQQMFVLPSDRVTVLQKPFDVDSLLRVVRDILFPLPKEPQPAEWVRLRRPRRITHPEPVRDPKKWLGS